LVNIFLSLVMVAYWRTQRVYPGFGLWTLCNASVGLMWVLFFLRGRIPVEVSILLPNMLASIALILRLEGLRRFLGRARFDLRTFALPLVVLALLLFFLFVHNNVFARTAVTTFSVGLVIWAMAALVTLRATGPHRLTYLLTGALWFLYGAMNLARGVYWLAVYEGNPLLQPGVFNESYYLATVLFDIAWTVVFISMNQQRTALDLEAAQTAAESSRDRLADIIAFLPDATFAVDREGRAIAWNRAAEELIGLSAAQVLGRPYTESIAPALGEARGILLDLVFDPTLPFPVHYQAVTREGHKVSAELDPVVLAGKRLSVWATASPLRDAKGELIGAIESVRDISALKQAEKEQAELLRRLLDGQRLESLGMMAGGIAHDFNNLLTVVQGNLALAAAATAPGSAQAYSLSEAMQASQRAATLTEHMRAYAGGGVFLKAPLDLERVVDESRAVLATMADDGIKLDYAVGKTPLIEGDLVAIRQVLAVLVTNAVESIGTGRGSVRVSTGSVLCDDEYLARSRLEDKPGPGTFAFLEVSDTGIGMDEEMIGRMFDPFYTTKFPGRGLGLSAASGIISGHQGAIIVTSEPANGTTFTVLLPAAHRA
jgi:PAS domain S-box-containing protein